MTKLKYTLIALITMLCALTLTSCMDLYDKDEVQTKFTVSFDKNGGTGSMEPMFFEYGETKKLTVNTFEAPANHQFKGWGEIPSGADIIYEDEASVTIYRDMKLYAIWQEQKGDGSYAVTYIDNDVSKVPPAKNYKKGETVPVKDKLEDRTGWSFEGWTSSDIPGKTIVLPGDEFIMPGTPVNLTAKWTENIIKGGGLEMRVSTESDAEINLTPNTTKDSSGIVTAVTFTVANDYSYNWYINGTKTNDISQTSSGEGTLIYTWNPLPATEGEYCIMTIAENSSKTYSATVYVTITK